MQCDLDLNISEQQISNQQCGLLLAVVIMK